MKKISKWILCLTLVVCIIIPTLFVSAATGFTAASDVNYVKAEGKYIVNWGDRDEDATFLSTSAQNFYKTGNTFEEVITLDGGTSKSNAHKSELYTKLKKIMTDAHSYVISYDATRSLFRYTDCIKNNSAQISSFYSGNMFNGTWDSGATWNREHVWPNSKGDLAGNGENDIMMLRPTLKDENGSRSNKAYGTTSAYYDPNAESGGKYDLRGDVSRIILYQYTRWGCVNTGSKFNPNDIFGTNGVIESLDVLLDWVEEDPVDTWEMGRNDAVQSITGTRNVFVDYPEYAWALFGEDCPDDLVTPSGNADLVPDASDRPDTPDEPEEPAGPALVDTPVVGTAYKFGLLQGNIGKTIFINGEMAKTYYFGSTEDPTAAIDVTLEQATGGYYLAAKIDGAKKYINLVTSGTHVNAVYQDTASSVYTLDTANKMLLTNVNSTPYALGTYNTFDTISPSKTSYTGNFWCWFYDATETPDTPVEPDVPDVPVDPEDPSTESTLTIKEAIALGSSKAHNEYTAEKYYVEGEITEVYNTIYGNMKIKDAEGNILTIYGTYSADGSTRYDALTTKPVVGDTVKIYGIVGQYNSTPQIKNGWIVEHKSSGTTPETPVDPKPDQPTTNADATISFADLANRVSADENQQVWAQNGITVTNDKGNSTSPVNPNYYNPVRFYKNSDVTIEFPGMTKIEIDCTNIEAKNKNAWVNSCSDDNATATLNGNIVTITFASAVDSFKIQFTDNQARANSIAVYTSNESG
ncbi:MAG: endonuclease, partial [Clostridia bacterium]|nr:endonuclease [Clostridia bacterium]